MRGSKRKKIGGTRLPKVPCCCMMNFVVPMDRGKAPKGVLWCLGARETEGAEAPPEGKGLAA